MEADVIVPKYATYAPGRGSGTWKMHETPGHVRNAISQNGWRRWDPVEETYIHQTAIRAVFAFRPDGTWERFTPDQIGKEWS